MSWSAETTTTIGNVVNALNTLSVNPPSSSGDQVAQVSAAIQAAADIVTSGSVTNSGNQVVDIQISGHANPGHQPTSGYASDTITVTVTQVPQTTGAN